MRKLDTRLDGPILLEPEVFGDHRGFFHETYRKNVFAELGIHDDFVQDNHSRSATGIVRGLHFQVGEGAAKLVRCARGAIIDYLVDVRPDSPAFGQWEGYELDDESLRLLYAPVGFAHGFVVTRGPADVMYKVSRYYDDATERGIKYDDPDVGIEYPEGLSLQASERDNTAPLLRDVKDELPFTYRPSAG